MELDLKGIFEKNLPLVIDAAGYQGRFVHELSLRRNRRGVIVKPLLVALTKETKEVYGFKDEDMDLRGIAKWFEFPEHMIDWLNTSPRDAVILLWHTFDGKDGPITRKLDGLNRYIEHLQRMNEVYLATIAKLEEENKDMRDMVKIKAQDINDIQKKSMIQKEADEK